MKRTFALFFFAVVAMPLWAQQEDVYLCIDAQGNREYRNVGGKTANCKRVDLPGVSVVEPVRGRPASRGRAASPTDFPRVSNAEQKARDSDRKRILQDEMKAEQKKLGTLQGEYKNGEPDRRGDERNYAKYQERTARLKDEVARTQRNIEALQRELGKLE